MLKKIGGGLLILFGVAGLSTLADGFSFIALIMALLFIFLGYKLFKGKTQSKKVFKPNYKVVKTSKENDKDIQKEIKIKSNEAGYVSPTTPRKPMKVPKYAYDEVLVVGAKYLEDKSGIKEAEEYDTVYLVPEPDNPYDPDAIRVEDSDERKLGYISKDSNIQSMIHDFTRRGDDVEAMIDGVSKEGVTLNIQFFRD